MDIRNAQRVDAQAIREIWENTFHYSRGFMDWYFRTMFEEKNTILAAEEEQAIASVSIQPQEMIMAGEKMDTCYIGAFAALPEYRNKETMRDVACAMTADIGRRGFAVSVVVPFNYKFFERFGWRTAYQYKQYKITPADIPDYQIHGKFQRNPADISGLAMVYDAFMHGRSGYFIRDSKAWQLILEDLTQNFGGRYVLLRDGQQTPVGYLLYIIHDGVMGVYEMAYTNRQAYESLLGFIRMHAMQLKTISMKMPDDDLTHLEFCDNRMAVTLCPFAMARVHRVRDVLGTLAKRFDGAVRIQVIDRLSEENNRTFAVSRDTVVETEAAPDVVTDIGAFTQLALGYLDTAGAVRMNMLSGKAELLKGLFRKETNYLNMLCY